jgi:intron-binding protein aquarius
MAPPSRRRKAPPKDEGASAKKSKKSSPQQSTRSVAQLDKELQSADGDAAVAKTLRQFEEQGVLYTIVWPSLKAAATKKKKDDTEWNRGCALLAKLVTNQEGKPSVSFCAGEDDMSVLSEVVATLLLAEGNDEKPEVIYFTSILLVNSETRSVVLPQVAAELLNFVPDRRLELELKKSAALRRSLSQANSDKPKAMWAVQWIEGLAQYIEGRSKYGDLFAKDSDAPRTVKTYLHRSLELLIDLLSAFDTRQFMVLYLDSIQFTVRCKLALQKSCNDRLVQQLVARIHGLLDFPVRSDKTPLSKEQVVSSYHARASILQKLCHRYHAEELPEVIYSGVGLLCNGKYLSRAMGGLNDKKVLDLLYRLRLVNDKDTFDGDREYMMAILMQYVSLPAYPLDQLKSFPLYPTEAILFDHNVIPPGTLLRKTPVLSIPKLHTQFLSYQDYLLRNFQLVRLESAYDIRSDLVDVVKRVKPVVRQSMNDAGDSNELALKTDFTGWARMAMETVEPVRIMRVTPPKLGERVPAQVVAEVTIDLVHCGDSIRREWDGLGEFDNLFLISIDATKMTGAPAPLVSEFEEKLGISSGGASENERRIPDDEDDTFAERYGVTAIRGCMVLSIRDEDGNTINDPALQDSRPKSRGTKRIMRVELDTAQYARDSRSKEGTGVYQTLNIIVRRHGRENNFRAVLETIRGLMEGSGSIGRVIPAWLQPIILGYGDAKTANYKSPVIKSYAMKTPGVAKPDAPLDFRDTFLDQAHLKESFPENKVNVGKGRNTTERRNFQLEFKDDTVKASSYAFPDNVQGNPVRFTPVQVEAIKSGLSLGLTMVVGPPGTGKSDVAVQIIANLYHTFPNQRTVIITHSNAALNDLFQKIMARGDIDERYLIRLGAGERDLNVDSSHDFSRVGRVSHSLARRGELLEKVQQLSESMGISGKAERGSDGSPSYTCESAGYFQVHYLKKPIDQFHSAVKKSGENEVGAVFPFSDFFGLSEEEIESMTKDSATSKLDAIDQIFAELEEYRPLELLRSQRQRTDYFLMKQAKIVAMTCTHAAIARSRLIAMGFQYDNVVMEEAAQLTEVETFIPLLLQRGETDLAASASSRLKRVCLIGDHNQLPPIVKNIAFARFSNLDQSLFARLIGFGVPHIQLNRQGRTRPEIANLFRWRYNGLGDLQHVTDSPEYKVANAGFAHTYQLINVEDYNGKGESTPTAYYYQNVGEAEYAVALFQFMVMLGYKPNKISILTTYNGQKELILDILRQRCGSGTPFAGLSPKTVSTVDQYQGQQNDYILLSLVRTKSVGYLRDVRRCVVAFSRARLGLFVLCRQSLFEACHELKPMMEQFQEKPNKLQIVLGEHFTATREANKAVAKPFEVSDVSHLGSMVHSMQEQWVKGN